MTPKVDTAARVLAFSNILMYPLSSCIKLGAIAALANWSAGSRPPPPKSVAPNASPAASFLNETRGSSCLLSPPKLAPMRNVRSRSPMRLPDAPRKLLVATKVLELGDTRRVPAANALLAAALVTIELPLPRTKPSEKRADHNDVTAAATMKSSRDLIPREMAWHSRMGACSRAVEERGWSRAARLQLATRCESVWYEGMLAESPPLTATPRISCSIAVGEQYRSRTVDQSGALRLSWGVSTSQHQYDESRGDNGPVRQH